MTRRPALFWCFILCLCHLPQAFPQNSADILLLYGNPQQFRYRYRDITVPGRFTGPVPVQHSRYSLNGAPAVSFYIQGTHSHTDGLTGYRLLNRHFTLEIPVSSPSLVPGANTVVLHIRDANNADHAFTLTFDWDPTPVPLPITLTDLSGFTSLQEIAQPVNGVWELDTAANVIRSTGGQYRDALLLLGSPHGSQEATYAVRFSGNNSFVGLSDFFAGHEDRVVPIGIKPGYSTAGLATVRGNGAAETWLAWGDLMKDHPDKWVRIHTGIPVPNAANLHDGRVYRVRHQMLFEDGVNSTRFKIWEDGQSEPAFWNSEVNDATVTKTNRFDTGIFSLFHSRATTEWFDIHVRSLDGPQMTLTVEAENGTVARLPSSESYPQGTMVTLSAVADNGHLFSHWTGDLTGSENPATLLMDAEKTVQAVFVPSPPPFEQWRMDNGVAEDTVVIHNQTYPAEHLFIMGAHRTSPDGPWQGLLRIESIIPEANGAHALNFQEQAGRRYRVWWTNDLRGIPEWHDMEHTEPEGPTLFFRLSVEHED